MSFCAPPASTASRTKPQNRPPESSCWNWSAMYA